VRAKFRLTALLIPLLAAAPALADLTAARAEPNLEKRSRKALENAEKVLNAARQAYQNGDLGKTDAALEELGESVALASESLKQTGKNPARSPKHFKHAEIKTRALLRRLDNFRDHMGVDERETLDRVRAVIDKINQELLQGIMGGKKK